MWAILHEMCNNGLLASRGSSTVPSPSSSSSSSFLDSSFSWPLQIHPQPHPVPVLVVNALLMLHSIPCHASIHHRRGSCGGCVLLQCMVPIIKRQSRARRRSEKECLERISTGIKRSFLLIQQQNNHNCHFLPYLPLFHPRPPHASLHSTQRVYYCMHGKVIPSMLWNEQQEEENRRKASYFPADGNLHLLPRALSSTQLNSQRYHSIPISSQEDWREDKYKIECVA